MFFIPEACMKINVVSFDISGTESADPDTRNLTPDTFFTHKP